MYLLFLFEAIAAGWGAPIRWSPAPDNGDVVQLGYTVFVDGGDYQGRRIERHRLVAERDIVADISVQADLTTSGSYGTATMVVTVGSRSFEYHQQVVAGDLASVRWTEALPIFAGEHIEVTMRWKPTFSAYSVRPRITKVVASVGVRP